jgi:carbamate kinase
VPSPEPRQIVELDSIKALLASGVVVIAAGGGGIPVADVGDGEYRGVAAVVDKDLALSLLACELAADLFLIATSVERVALEYGTPRERPVSRLTLAEARACLAEGTHFAEGSMAPKIRAVVQYLERGGRRAIITAPDRLGDALRGETGTLLEP